MIEEIWKDIKDYEGLYQVSNFGNVKRVRSNILKNQIRKDGYEYVTLCKHNKRSKFLVHRLVAEAFLDKNNFKCMPYENRQEIDLDTLQVNHILDDFENKRNNNINNLEWCTSKYNCNYGNRNSKLAQITPKKAQHNKEMCKTVYQYDLNGNLIQKWESAVEVEKQLGYASSNVASCCRGKYSTMYGYAWRYEICSKNDIINEINNKYLSISKTVMQYDMHNNFIKEWKSSQEVKRQLGYNPTQIINCCNGKAKTGYGFIWKYKDKEGVI